MPSGIDALARFASLLGASPSSRELRDLLVENAVDLVGAGAAVLVEVGAAGAPAIAARSGFDAEVSFAEDALLGGDVGAALVNASAGRFAASAAIPLVSSGGLYGVLVLLFTDTAPLDAEHLQIAGMLVDIVAASLARANEIAELERAYDELKQSKHALAQGEKLRAIGGMAAGISHDVKNVFTPLLMMLDVIKSRDDLPPELREDIEMMRQPLHRGLAIVDRLRKFSRPVQHEGRELVEPSALVNDAVDLCRPRAPAAVHIVVESSAAPLVRVEAADAVAAITNLVINALDAVGASGAVTVRSGTRDGGAFIDVSDTGPGVPEHVRKRLFEPFFTTKGSAGTGLGLAMVKELAQRHGGRLDLDSAPGAGACFRLWLPAATA